MQVINVKVDVCKIEKSRLFEGKNGAKYLNLTLIPTTNSKYGDDYFVVQSVTKEERERGVKGPILGNAKIMGAKTSDPKEEVVKEEEDTSDVPF